MDADWSVELGADDAALEFPWSSPEGARRYVDLSRHPKAVVEISEAVQYPELGNFLRAINQPESPWLTVKCDVWVDEELHEAEAVYDAKLKLCSYVDLVAREDTVRLSFERHERWVKSAASALSSDDKLPVMCEFIVRRCWFHAEGGWQRGSAPGEVNPVPGFCVTSYLFGYGDIEGQARARWADGLRRITSVLVELRP